MLVYQYDKNGFYTGTPLEVDEKRKTPRSTPYKPNESEGLIPWWTGIGWWPVKDLEPLSLDQCKSVLLDVCASIRAPYPEAKYSPAEQAAWELQLAYAKQYLEKQEADDHLVELALEDGVELKEMAEKIVAKHKERQTVVLKAASTVQKLRNQIKSATSVSQLPSYSMLLRMSLNMD